MHLAIVEDDQSLRYLMEQMLLVSGYVTEEIRAHAAAAGVWQVLAKPLSAKELCEVIHRLLSTPA